MNRPFARAVLLALLLGMLAQEGWAGSKESQACNICRKGKEPGHNKFPDGVNSCDDGFYPSATCPVVVNNVNVDTGGDSVSHANCHTDPYLETCSKKETKHPQKYNSTKKQNTHSSISTGITFLGIMALIAMVFACFGIMALASMRNNAYPQMYNIQLDEYV